MRHLVIGLGEVGKALQEILQCDGIDKDPEAPENFVEDEHYDMIHIAFGYGPEFEKAVIAYQERFDPKYTVIHSTVPVGTSRKLGATHSPIRGKHPNLKESILTFHKFVGGPDAQAVALELRSHGIKDIGLTEKQEDCEAMKLWDTTQYGLMIMLQKLIHQYCQEHNLSFNAVYTVANETYNDGYEQLGITNVQRPVLRPQEGKIGGHCVVQNCKLLDSPIAKQIIEFNKTL